MSWGNEGGPMRGRYVAPIPETDGQHHRWKLRSAYLLQYWEPTRARVLEALELDRALDPSELKQWINERRSRFSGKPLHVPLPSLPDAGLKAGGIIASTDDDGVQMLMRLARQMQDELGSPLADNIGFLLLGADIELPRLQVTYRPSRIGLVLEIRVGEGNVSENEVKAAYMEARRRAIGTSSSKPPQADAFIMALQDIEWREAGLTGPERADAWAKWSEQNNVGQTKLDYHGYRKQVAKTLARVPWLSDYAKTIDQQKGGE